MRHDGIDLRFYLAQLCAHGLDVGVHRAGVDEVFVIPHVAEEGFARLHAAAALDQQIAGAQGQRVGRIRRRHAVELDDLKFLRAHTDRRVKITVPGPFTMSQQAQNDFYKDEEEMALDYAAAVNEEIKDLFTAGADIVHVHSNGLLPEAAGRRSGAVIAYSAVSHEGRKVVGFEPEVVALPGQPL